MSESRSDDQADRHQDRADPRPKPELTPDSDPEPGVESPAVERRAFLRQLTGEAITTSARLAGLSSVMRRSLFAAVESATPDADRVTRPEPEPVAGPAAEADAPATLPPTVPPAPATATTSAAAPVSPVALSARQEEFLATATTAVLALNDAAGGPHLTASRFHWDGTLVRLPSDLFAARVARVEADPRVSLLVTAEGPDAWVAIEGTATIVAGDAAAEGMLQILRKYMTDEAADVRRNDLRATENPVVIEIRPSRYLWRFR